MTTSQSIQTIEVEAESLQEARKQIRSQIPQGLSILSEKIISDGKPKTAKGLSEKTEEAFMKAQNEVPSGAVIMDKKELAKPESKSLIIEEYNESGVRKHLEKQYGDSVIIKVIKLVTSGKKGFLGIGKKPSQYEVELLHKAIIEITFKTKAKVSVEIGDINQIRRDRAIDWWKKASGTKKCDICSTHISVDQGYLLDTKEMLNSRKYLSHAKWLRSCKVRSEQGLGLDAMELMEPMIEILVEKEIGMVTTPWLICEKCLKEYISET
jgi:hypothetical protein